MSKKQKPLLQEGTVRRMMKLANMDALGDGFISERYTPLEEDEAFTAKKENPGDDKRKGAEKRGAEGTLAKTKGHGKVDFVKEDLTEEDELESELGATEDELGAEDEFADEESAELEGEVTITDEEAQDIIALADKLKDAVDVGEEEPVGDEDEFEIGAEEEISMEEPANRSMYEEELYEAALKGLNLDFVEDKKARKEAMIKEVKGRVYKRVIDRLIKQGKK